MVVVVAAVVVVVKHPSARLLCFNSAPVLPALPVPPCLELFWIQGAILQTRCAAINEIDQPKDLQSSKSSDQFGAKGQAGQTREIVTTKAHLFGLTKIQHLESW